MSVFFSADFHLGHANIIKYCKRPGIEDPLFFGKVGKVYGDVEGNIDIVFRNGAGSATKVPFDGMEKTARSWSTNVPKAPVKQ